MMKFILSEITMIDFDKKKPFYAVLIDGDGLQGEKIIIAYLGITMKEYIHNIKKFNAISFSDINGWNYVFKQKEDCLRFIEEYLEPMAVMKELSQ